MKRKYIITGPPGSGKTSVIEELLRDGYHCVEESSRRFIKEELARGGDRLPWKDVESFDRAILRDRLSKYFGAIQPITFFDRGVLDSLAYLEVAGIEPDQEFMTATQLFKYQPEVFFLPSWKEIYRTDDERKEPFERALRIEEALKKVYIDHGYELIVLPKVPVLERVALIEVTVKRLGGGDYLKSWTDSSLD